MQVTWHIEILVIDDERDTSSDDGKEMAPNIHNSPLPVNEGATFATSIDDAGDISEGNLSNNSSFGSNGEEPQTVRKSSRMRSIPSKFNDFVLLSNKKYVLDNSQGLCLSQRKYCMEFLSEYGLLGCKPAATPMQQNESSYICLHAYSDVDWAKCLDTRKSVSGLCVYFCGNLVSWKSKKQATISMSSAKAEYRCMASTSCKIIWITHLLNDLGLEGLLPVPLYCDSTYAIQIAANPVFHEKTKHF
ncbi:ribonuclease H-like domain-containing protein [Tanacetum coccineum]